MGPQRGCDARQVRQLLELVPRWVNAPVEDALEMLGQHFMHAPIRALAVTSRPPPLWGYNPMQDDRSDFTESSSPVILHGVVSPDPHVFLTRARIIAPWQTSAFWCRRRQISPV